MLDKKQILQELHRIKYLTDYKSGVVLSEQKNIIDSDSEKKLNFLFEKNGDGGVKKTETKRFVNGGIETRTKEEFTFSKRFDANYSKNDNSPKNFLANSYKEIIDEIKKKNPQNLEIIVIGATVTGNASNNWMGNKTTDMSSGTSNPMQTSWTNYDLDNDYVTVSKYKDSGTDAGYTNNKNLAKKRAENFWSSLVVELNKTKTPFIISVAENIAPEYKSNVINTGGYVDEDSRKKLPNRGQTILLNLKLAFKEEKVTFEKREGLAERATSTHWCSGEEGSCVFIDDIQTKAQTMCKKGKEWQVPLAPAKNPNSCPMSPKVANSPLSVHLHNFIIQYKLENSSTWDFYWQNGRIYKITRNISANHAKLCGTPKEKGFTTPNIVDDAVLLNELRMCMNLVKKSQTSVVATEEKATRKSFDWYVEPYLTEQPMLGTQVPPFPEGYTPPVPKPKDTGFEIKRVTKNR